LQHLSVISICMCMDCSISLPFLFVMFAMSVMFVI